MADSFALSFFESVEYFKRQVPEPIRQAPIVHSPPQKEIYGYDEAVEYAELQKLPNLFGSTSEAQYRYAFVVRKIMLDILDGCDSLGLHEGIVKHLQRSVDKLKTINTVLGVFAYHGHFNKAKSQKAKVLKSPVCVATTKLMRANKDFRCMIQSIIWTESNDELANLCGLEEWWDAKKKHLATVQNNVQNKETYF